MEKWESGEKERFAGQASTCSRLILFLSVIQRNFPNRPPSKVCTLLLMLSCVRIIIVSKCGTASNARSGLYCVRFAGSHEVNMISFYVTIHACL